MTYQLVVQKIGWLELNNKKGVVLSNKIFKGFWVFVLLSSGVFFSSLAIGFEITHELTGQWRGFVHDGDMDQKRSDFSLEYETELFYEFASGNDSFTFVPKIRLDQNDSDRTLFDIQKAYWNHLGDGWELRAGIHKVFWGVTESRHLVDVINQTDLVSALDQEDKLGQPMINASFEFEPGILDVFLLAGFRERTFPGEDGRFRSYIAVDGDSTHYESSKEETRIDWAARWVQTIDSTDIGLHVFSGTSREPLFLFNNNIVNPKFEPYYPVITQIGLDLQHVYEAWLFKLEVVHRRGFDLPSDSNMDLDADYESLVTGFEYTQVGIFNTAMDLGWIGEYLYDSRGEDDGLALFEDDWFVGWRLAFNDIDDSELLTGVIWDPTSSEKTLGVEYSQRLTEALALSFEARTWFDGDKVPASIQQALLDLQTDGAKGKLTSLMNDDYVELNLTYYF